MVDLQVLGSCETPGLQQKLHRIHISNKYDSESFTRFLKLAS